MKNSIPGKKFTEGEEYRLERERIGGQHLNKVWPSGISSEQKYK
jgi:hypothetical protein